MAVVARVGASPWCNESDASTNPVVGQLKSQLNKSIRTDPALLYNTFTKLLVHLQWENKPW